jgi:hypothetical protein
VCVCVCVCPQDLHLLTLTHLEIQQRWLMHPNGGTVTVIEHPCHQPGIEEGRGKIGDKDKKSRCASRITPPQVRFSGSLSS